jgi:hypothetical protein
MNCYHCHKQLKSEKIDWEENDYYSQFPNRQFLECPNLHCSVILDGSQIVKYEIFYSPSNYLISGINAPNDPLYTTNTKLFCRSYKSKYEMILELPYFIPLSIRDNTIQGELLLKKLKTYLVFS